MALYIVQQLILLVFCLVNSLLSQLILMCQVIYVAFERVNLLDARLLSLLDFS